MGLEGETIIIFTTDNGTENFTWPDGGQTPFAGGKGTAMEGGFRAPMILAGPARCPRARSRTASSPASTGFRRSSRRPATRNIVDELKKGKQLGDRTYKVHLDGYNQMDLITGKGPSKRHEIFYFTESTLSAVRIDDFKYRFTDQPNGWLGATVKVDWPILVNLRLDPFERTGMFNGKDNGSISYYNWFVYEFWRFVFVQQEVAKLAQTAIEFPPMQKGASFNLEAVKAQIERRWPQTGADKWSFFSINSWRSGSSSVVTFHRADALVSQTERELDACSPGNSGGARPRPGSPARQ